MPTYVAIRVPGPGGGPGMVRGCAKKTIAIKTNKIKINEIKINETRERLP